MTAHAQQLRDDGHLLADATVEEARDVLWTDSSSELYDLLVQGQGWNATRYGHWVADAYIAPLLPRRARRAGGLMSGVGLTTRRGSP